GRNEEPLFCLGRQHRTEARPLLSGARSDVPDGIRQHPERREPHSRRLARFRTRFWRRSAARTLRTNAAPEIGALLQFRTRRKLSRALRWHRDKKSFSLYRPQVNLRR